MCNVKSVTRSELSPDPAVQLEVYIHFLLTFEAAEHTFLQQRSVNSLVEKYQQHNKNRQSQ